MKSRLSIFSLLFLLLYFNLFAQDQKEIDSLYNVLKTTCKDTVKVNVAHQLFYKYVLRDTAKAKSLCQQIKTIAEKTNSKKALTTYYNDMGIFHFYRGNYIKSINFFEESLLLRKELGDKKGESAALNNIGLNYASQGNFVKAIEYYHRSLKMDEELGYLKGVASSYDNIGVIHYQQNNYSEANEYYQKSLQILNELLKKTTNNNEKQDINKSISSSYTNIGLVYYSQKKLSKALEFYNKSLKMIEELGDKQGMSQAYNNIGMVYDDQENFAKAIEYYQKAVTMLEDIDDKGGAVVVLNNIAILKNRQKNYKESIIFSEKSLNVCKEIGSIDDERIAWSHLAVSYKGLKNFEKSLNCYERSMHLKDSIFNIEKNNQFSEMEAKYNNEKKQKEIELLNKNKELQKIEVKSLKLQKYAFVIGFILTLTLAFVSFRSIRQKRKANILLSEQKNEIEERNEELNQQNEEICTQRDEIEAQRDLVSDQKKQIENIYSEVTDSIYYAERIQKAVMPSAEYLSNLLQDYFILFKPKDIVSGDFYYVAKRNQFLLIAVADCTGHGVPGAFMSMLGISFLNEIIAKDNIMQADHVLNELREYVVKSLQQKGVSGEQKDGMDISFIVYDTLTNVLQYSGANSPLYIVSKDSNELTEIKSDKMPVSIFVYMKPFTNHVIKVQQGDIIYLCSDGYSDQFGGNAGRKFYSKHLKQILVKNCNEPMIVQKELLEKAVEDWKKNEGVIYKQTDDITVMGIKFNI
jgi:serine phosphatase RsbU (regulator of sigma subunit)/Tfp pilus assembly protein PilF